MRCMSWLCLGTHPLPNLLYNPLNSHNMIFVIFLVIIVYALYTVLHRFMQGCWVPITGMVGIRNFQELANVFGEGFPCGSAGKESTCNVGDLGLIPGLGRSPGEGKGYPLHYSGLEDSIQSTGSQRVKHCWATFTFTPTLQTISIKDLGCKWWRRLLEGSELHEAVWDQRFWTRT